MGQSVSARVEPGPRTDRNSWRLARVGLNWMATLATGAAVVIAAALTLVFAATLAVVVLLAGALFGLYALTLRARRTSRRDDGPVVLEARRVGHSWVAYGWDQRR